MTHQIQVPWYRHRVLGIITGAVLAALAGLGSTQLAEPQRVTETRVVTETPRECVAALDEADRALVIGTEFGRMMIGLRDSDNGIHHFNEGGRHWQDSHRFLDTMTAATEAFRSHKTACVNGGRSDG